MGVLESRLRLERYSLYTRGEIAQILAPDYRFQEQVGTWGLHGIVRFGIGPNFAFFVTLGQVQGEHHFDEAVYESGVVRWQSQPRQGLADKTIMELISHDESSHDILLFLRTRRRAPYLYMGKLRYLNHDKDRQNPVHFSWQLIDFDPLHPAIHANGLQLESVGEGTAGAEMADPGFTSAILRPEQRPMARRQGLALSTKIFRETKIDYVARDSRNRSLGLKGEMLVAAYEKVSLVAAGREDLADGVEVVSVTRGDGLGYDIRSFEVDGREKHIEVKTTSGPANTPFFMSSAERAYAARCPENYVIYRIYGYDQHSSELAFFIVRGVEVSECLGFEPFQYRVSLL